MRVDIALNQSHQRWLEGACACRSLQAAIILAAKGCNVKYLIHGMNGSDGACRVLVYGTVHDAVCFDVSNER